MMKRTLLVLWIGISMNLAAFGQQPPVWVVLPNSTIESVNISGLSDTKLSPEFRADIQKLVGQVYNADAVNELALGISIELPEYVAAVTPQPGSQPDRVRVVLVVAKIADNEALKTNINSRYIVDAVEVGGSYKAKISDALNTDLQSMVGKNLDNTRAEELRGRIAMENSSASVDVSRKLRRGGSPQHVKILYEASQSTNNFGFSFSSVGLYHSRQGFTAPDNKLSAHHLGAGTLTFRLTNDPQPLVERYAGYSLAYSAERGRLRFDLEYSSYRAQWKENSLQADAQLTESPGLYRVRDTIGVTGSASLPLQLKVTAGVDFVGMQMQSPVKQFLESNAFKGKLTGQFLPGLGPTHASEWNYEVRSATDWLNSDFIYTRHQLNLNYYYNRNSKTVVSARFLAGRITGNAPMFERFSIGNGTMLRGWNKYEINPLGGTRVAYASVEYTYKIVTGFYDLGSVWTGSQSARSRSSAGFKIGFNNCKGVALFNPLCFVSVGVGFPIHGDGRPSQPSLILGF